METVSIIIVEVSNAKDLENPRAPIKRLKFHQVIHFYTKDTINSQKLVKIIYIFLIFFIEIETVYFCLHTSCAYNFARLELKVTFLSFGKQ